MAVSVVGFDVGCLSSCVAVARAGGIETILNEYSERRTPTCIAFTEKNRLIGMSAKVQHVTNVKNTFVNFLPLIGKKFNDPAVKREQSYLPYKLEPSSDGGILVRVTRSDGHSFFTPEQLTAMQLAKLKELAEQGLSSKVVDVVINVPTYYTDAERRAMLDISKIAGLNCVKLVNDTTAIGTAYGLYRELPPTDKPPRNVAFVNVGYVSTQVAVCAFNTGKMKVLCTASDWQLGGRDFDCVLFQKLTEDFYSKYGKRVDDSPKATVRLLQECEKVKKQMSANSQELPVSIECLLDEKDLLTRVKRADFESWTTELQLRFTNLLQQCLSDSKLDTKDIHSVELVGGSSRIPILKAIVTSVFKQEGSTTLNADEAVSRGCALQAAICSPVFKVREFNITEACPYAIRLHWDQPNSAPQLMCVGENDGEVPVANSATFSEVFPLFYPIPSSRRLSFNRQGAFVLEARYASPETLPNQNSLLGVFKVSNPHQKPGEVSKIRVKVRINGHGIFSVAQAEVAEEYEKEVEVDVSKETQSAPVSEASNPMEVEVVPNNGDVSMEAHSNSVDAEKASVPEATAANDKPPAPQKTITKKKAVRYKELPVEAIVPQLSESQLNEFCETEGKLFEQDQLEHHRAHAKNAVEEYIYEMRGKVQDSLSAFATPGEQKALMDALTLAEDWLYSDGEDLHRQAYVDRLNQMKFLGDPIEMRASEKQNRTSAVSNFEHSLVHIRKVLDSALAGAEAYNHLTPEQLDLLGKTLAQYDGWLREKMCAQQALPLTTDPAIKASEISAQQKAMESICHPIINTPKPAPPPAPPAPGAAASPQPNDSNSHPDAASPKSKTNAKGKSNKSPKAQQQQNCTNTEMDVD